MLALECKPMSEDWISEMFVDRDSQEELAARRVEQEQFRQKKIAELAPAIWSEIESVLKGAIAAFNRKSPIPINIDPYSREYTLEVNAANYRYGFIVKFEVSTGTISYGNPLTEFTHSNLLINIDEESHYTLQDSRNPKEPILLKDIDEVVLKGFMKLILKEG